MTDAASLASTGLTALAALIGVLALLVLVLRAVRAAGAGHRAGRRLAVEEALALDSRRRLLLLRCDGRELLLLTGGTQDLLVAWLPPPAPGPGADAGGAR